MNFKIVHQEIKRALLYSPDPRIKLAEIWGNYYSPYYRFFWQMGMYLPNDALMVELGVHNGRGICSMAMSGKEVVGIDHTYTYELGQNIKRFPNIEFIHSDTCPVPSCFQGKEIHFLHIDTEHTYETAKNEFESYQPYFADECIVVFDDLHAKDDDVLKYFYERPEGNKMQVDAMHPETGWGVLLWQK